MTEIKLTAIFAIVLALDGLILPALFGLRESFLSLLVLIVPILYIGPTTRSVSLGLFFAFISETLRGLDLGVLALPFLFVVVLIYLTQLFLDIKYTHNTRFGLGKSVLIALISVAFIYIFSVFYLIGLTPHLSRESRIATTAKSNFSKGAGLMIATETLLLVLVFNAVFNKKNDYVS
ncbi:MAG: hypothetical protein A3J47_01685 [Candidatus Yanofskybacteria bacterium RIFCSPHIGHO2_02_FULL_43_22]|uniref:Rod shape-determining protein MreD n=1 Tax=Candidatus Yanofskybacteria bacterium RIFCSPHIGHO2_02_FULL_43_22 TaxID=1802681 RepID=A0A1F8FRW3_9BACT|nr:MAG: hypothetical protein A3J47_01685 [Candidatus Yanofskybacteria bacterium RIFCSPHIGHO2_02_FULL_43_22]